MNDLAKHGLKYHLLRAKPPFKSPSTPLHNKAFEFWVSQWTHELAKISPNEKLNADEFLRQDYMSVVTHGSEVVALHFYSLFDLAQDAARSHSYFGASYSPRAMEALKKHGVRWAMSFEYFTVAPQWRGSAAGFSLAATLLGLGLKFFGELGADAALGICRIDLGVAKLCYSAGAVTLDSNQIIHGVACDLVGIMQGSQKPYRREEENLLADSLWSDRVDYTIESPHFASSKAA